MARLVPQIPSRVVLAALAAVAACDLAHAGGSRAARLSASQAIVGSPQELVLSVSELYSSQQPGNALTDEQLAALAADSADMVPFSREKSADRYLIELSADGSNVSFQRMTSAEAGGNGQLNLFPIQIPRSPVDSAHPRFARIQELAQRLGDRRGNERDTREILADYFDLLQKYPDSSLDSGENAGAAAGIGAGITGAALGKKLRFDPGSKELYIDGNKADLLGNGKFKWVYTSKEHPDWVIKIFYRDGLPRILSRLSMWAENRNLKRLAAIGSRLGGALATRLLSTGLTADGYFYHITERVYGTLLKDQLLDFSRPLAMDLRVSILGLVRRLWKNKLVVRDLHGGNMMTGVTMAKPDDPQLYIIDAVAVQKAGFLVYAGDALQALFGLFPGATLPDPAKRGILIGTKDQAIGVGLRLVQVGKDSRRYWKLSKS